LDEACAKSPSLKSQSSPHHSYIQIPELHAVPKPALQQDTQHEEQIDLSRIEEAEQAISDITPQCTSDKKRRKLQMIEK